MFMAPQCLSSACLGTYIAMKHLFVEHMLATLDCKFTGGEVPSVILCVAQPPRHRGSRPNRTSSVASAGSHDDNGIPQNADSDDGSGHEDHDEDFDATGDDPEIASSARMHIHAARMCLRTDGAIPSQDFSNFNIEMYAATFLCIFSVAVLGRLFRGACWVWSAISEST